MITFLIKQAQKRKVYIKYLVSGGTASAVDLIVLFLLKELFGIWYLTSAIIAFVIAFFVSFYLQKFWTFRDNDRKKMRKQMLIYFLVGLTNLGVNTLGMYTLVDKFNIMYIVAQLIMMALVAVSNFLIYRFVIFKNKNEQKENIKKIKNISKILIATGIYPPDIGGPATYVKTLCEELPKHGFKIRVITYSDKNKLKDEYDIIRVIRSSNIIIRYLKYFFEVWKNLSWSDVVFVQGPVSEGLPAWLACKLRGRDYILKIVGDYAWEQGRQRHDVKELLDEFQEKKYDNKVEKIRNIQKLVARDARLIITPSQYLKSIVKKWGVSEDKIKVIYNAVDFKAQSSKQKNHEEKWLITVCRLAPWKGVDTLIKIMPELLKSEPNLKLKIIGDGPDKGRLDKQIKKQEAGEYALLLGRLSNDETLSYISAGDLFILNSGYEGLSHVILEALSFDKAVLASNKGGNTELIIPGKTGDLFEYNNKQEISDKIKYFLDTNDGKNNMLEDKENNLFFEKFKKKTMISDIVKILKS